MEYEILKFTHVLGAVLMGAGLIGVWMADLRSRQLSELKPFAEAVRNIAVFYDGLVVPGALLLLISGTWMIVKFYGGWGFLQIPWLAGMVGITGTVYQKHLIYARHLRMSFIASSPSRRRRNR
jgi:hypothetical protein